MIGNCKSGSSYISYYENWQENGASDALFISVIKKSKTENNLLVSSSI